MSSNADVTFVSTRKPRSYPCGPPGNGQAPPGGMPHRPIAKPESVARVFTIGDRPEGKPAEEQWRKEFVSAYHAIFAREGKPIRGVSLEYWHGVASGVCAVNGDRFLDEGIYPDLKERIQKQNWYHHEEGMAEFVADTMVAWTQGEMPPKLPDQYRVQCQCGQFLQLESKKNKLFYVCPDPSCGSEIQAHYGDRVPTGLPAESSVRRLRAILHEKIRHLLSTTRLNQKEIYTRLSLFLNIPRIYAHIGFVTDEETARVYQWGLDEVERTADDFIDTRGSFNALGEIY